MYPRPKSEPIINNYLSCIQYPSHQNKNTSKHHLCLSSNACSRAIHPLNKWIPKARVIFFQPGPAVKLYLLQTCRILSTLNTPPLISLVIWTKSGLKICAACCNSGTHSPLLLLVASWAGTQPNGPVPVTRTLLAPNSYNLCIIIIYVTIISVEPISIWMKHMKLWKEVNCDNKR